MKYVIEFYKELDTINLILFWGIIIVILLLLIFAIIITNRNKKLKRIIDEKEQEVEETKNDLAIKTEQINLIENNKIEENKFISNIKEQEDIIKTEENNYQVNNDINVIIPPKEEKFIVEEHVIDYDKNNDFPPEEDITPKIPDIDEDVPEENIQINIEAPKEQKKDIIMPTGPYQRNVLKEMSLGQTSPIGIVKRETNYNQELNKAQELHDTLQNVEVRINHYENNYQKEMHNSKEMINKIYEREENSDDKAEKIIKEEIKTPELEILHPKEEPKKETDYLKEVSQKLSEAEKTNDIKRTEYEIQQEEEAIISYEELMRKKDQLKMIDEEEAIISIEELYSKNKPKEKLYNITKEEEDEKFISELKHFRSDL